MLLNGIIVLSNCEMLNNKHLVITVMYHTDYNDIENNDHYDNNDDDDDQNIIDDNNFNNDNKQTICNHLGNNNYNEKYAEHVIYMYVL